MKKPLLVALALAASGLAFSQTPVTDPAATARIDKRELRQQRRIDQGVASGQITPKEHARLNAQQNRIEAAEARAKADGVVTAKERARLEHQQDKASRNIRRNKHDRQKS